MARQTIRQDCGTAALALRSVATTALVFSFFEVLPHYPVGVSEVHLILGSTLFLIFGAGAASIGLAAGLLLQGLFFAPFDLPQYGINVTTLLVPLFAVSLLARRSEEHTSDLQYPIRISSAVLCLNKKNNHPK